MPSEMDRAPCPQNMAGCASVIDGEMMVFIERIDAAEHEMTHIILWPLGVGNPLLVEGIAECFGGLFHDTPLIWRRDGDGVVDMVNEGLSNTTEYHLAGEFSCRLAQVFGVPKLMEAVLRSRPDMSISELNGVFHTVFGVSFEEAVDDFADDTSGCYDVPLRCNLPTIPRRDADTWIDNVVFACGDPRTEGSSSIPLSEVSTRDTTHYRLETERILEIDAPDTYRICITDEQYVRCDPEPRSIGSPPPSATALSRYSSVDRNLATGLHIAMDTAQCRVGPGCPNAVSLTLPLGFDHPLYLEAGTYRLHIRTTDDTPEILRRTDAFRVFVRRCSAEGQSFSEECRDTQDLVCGTRQCRICDTMVHGLPVQDNPLQAGLAPVCFMCRCTE